MSKLNKRGTSVYNRTIHEGDLHFVALAPGFRRKFLCLN